MSAAAHQSGAAVVLAMAIVALAAIVATAIMLTQSTWAREIELATDHRQARELVPAGVDWARRLLSEDRRVSSIDHLGELWATPLPPTAVGNATVSGAIEDQQGRFNLNNVVRAGNISVVQLTQFKRLLAILDLPATLADSLADWIDADNVPQGFGGAEDDYYLQARPPHLAANRALVDVDELSLVRGFDSKVLSRLLPFVTALPRSTQVNVNTAPPELLAAIVQGMDLDGARSLAAQRQRGYFRNVEDFAAHVPHGMHVPAEELTVSSDYFKVSLTVTRGEVQAGGNALLARDGPGWPAIVWRKYP